MADFSLVDMGGTVSTDHNDELIKIVYTMGSDLEWGMLSVVLSIDGGAPVTCGLSAAGDGSGTTSVCYMVEIGDTTDAYLTLGDGMNIYENGQDLCSSMCTVDVQINHDSTVMYFGSVIVDDS